MKLYILKIYFPFFIFVSDLMCLDNKNVVLTCLSLCNTQPRAVNLIDAVLCDDEGVTQARGC